MANVFGDAINLNQLLKETWTEKGIGGPLVGINRQVVVPVARSDRTRSTGLSYRQRQARSRAARAS